MDANSWLIVAYVTTIFAVTAFAAFAVVYTRFYSKTKLDTTEDFIAARGTQNKYRIAWSFFAGAVGAWVIVSPPAYASFAGVLGLVFYSLASGIPLIVAALFGGKIQSAMPDCCSLSDFIGYRFGPVAKMMVILLTLFNMSIAMLAEYTTIGSLFQDFVGSLNYPIIIVVGFLTICYTAYGGLSVSIMTDQLQGAFSVILVTLLSLYVAITFREPLPTPNFGGGFVADLLGPNIYGYSAIFVMPCSLMAATVFSEAIWQRVWASEDQKALRFGATAGAIGVIIVVFLIGFSGILGVWSGLIVFCDPMAPEIPCTNPNLYLFSVSATPAISRQAPHLPQLPGAAVHICCTC
jgi:SSS family solute:Na+ symporter